MKRFYRIALTVLIFPPLFAALVGWFLGAAFLHPIRRPLTADDIRNANATFSQIGARGEEFDVPAPDGILLRGWKVRAGQASGQWVLLFHGIADNRMGVLEHARMLLLAGYSVVMMDARAHGASEGVMATYGWLERNDTRAVIDALESSEHPRHLFALGESMGAGIALQSAAVDPRIEGVVAEAPFASLREASYDYAGLRRSPLIGKTIFAPFSWTLIYRGESLAGFSANEVSPKRSVAARAFPVLLICGEQDAALPCRHSEGIFRAARGPKELWRVPGAFHTAAFGFAPEEFRLRVLAFFQRTAQGG